MSSVPSYSISISGDSNDSDLVLGSASGSITENPASANLAPLTNRVTTLETKTATLETKTATLETKTATLEASMNAVTTLSLGIAMGATSNEGTYFPGMLDEELLRLSHGKMRATLFINPTQNSNTGPNGTNATDVSNGLVDATLIWANYVAGGNISSLPANGLSSAYTGLTALELNEYYTSEQGRKDYEVIYANTPFVGLPACQIGPEAFGWSKTEITSLADMKDLSSIRMPGQPDSMLGTIARNIYGSNVVSAGGGATALGVSNETFDFWEWNGLPGDEAWLTGNSPSALQKLKSGTPYNYYYPQAIHQETLLADVIMTKTRFNTLTEQEKLWLREASSIVSRRFYDTRLYKGIEIENKIRDPSNTEWSTTIQIQDTPLDIIEAFKAETVRLLDAAAATDISLSLMLNKLKDFAKRKATNTRVTTLERDLNNLENSYPINFFLGLYETGPYAANGYEYVAGLSDYLTLVNQKGGINDLEINLVAEETRYSSTILANRLKQKTYLNGGLTAYSPLSTGGAFATYTYSADKQLPIINLGYGNNQTICGELFPYAFNAAPTYQDEMATFLEAVKLKHTTLEDKNIVYLYHNSAYGTNPLPTLKHFSKNWTQYQLDASDNLIIDGVSGPINSVGGDPSGCVSYFIPVQHPGTTLQQDTQFAHISTDLSNLDALFTLSWGPMIVGTEKYLLDNSFLIPKTYYGWWSYNPIYRETDPDISNSTPSDFSGLNVLTFNSMGHQSTDISMTTTELNALGVTTATNADISGGIEILEEIRDQLYSQYNLTNYTYGYFKNSDGFSDETMLRNNAGNLYMRGVLNGFILKKAFEKAHLMIGSTTPSGRPKHITGLDLKNALDNLTITQAEIDAEGMTLNCQPITMTTTDHKGANGISVYTANSAGVFELIHPFLKYSDESVINGLILN